MSSQASLDEVVELARHLSTVDKLRLIERISPQIAAEISKSRQEPRRSAWGLCKDLGPAPSAEEIDVTRREMLEDFPRSDL